MDAGGNLTGVYYPALVQRSFQAARYWGAGLSRLQREDRIVWTALTLADRQAVGYHGRDDADLVNVLSAIEDVDVAIIFVEQGQSRVKISWRLCGLPAENLDVSQVARSFGGGGHKAASGAEIDGTLEEVQQRVLASTRSMLVGADRI
jgi:phosphoesterase RecJ-like protein